MPDTPAIAGGTPPAATPAPTGPTIKPFEDVANYHLLLQYSRFMEGLNVEDSEQVRMLHDVAPELFVPDTLNFDPSVSFGAMRERINRVIWKNRTQLGLGGFRNRDHFNQIVNYASLTKGSNLFGPSEEWITNERNKQLQHQQENAARAEQNTIDKKEKVKECKRNLRKNRFKRVMIGLGFAGATLLTGGLLAGAGAALWSTITAAIAGSFGITSSIALAGVGISLGFGYLAYKGVRKLFSKISESWKRRKAEARGIKDAYRQAKRDHKMARSNELAADMILRRNNEYENLYSWERDRLGLDTSELTRVPAPGRDLDSASFVNVLADYRARADALNNLSTQQPTPEAGSARQNGEPLSVSTGDPLVNAQNGRPQVFSPTKDDDESKHFIPGDFFIDNDDIDAGADTDDGHKNEKDRVDNANGARIFNENGRPEQQTNQRNVKHSKDTIDAENANDKQNDNEPTLEKEDIEEVNRRLEEDKRFKELEETIKANRADDLSAADSIKFYEEEIKKQKEADKAIKPVREKIENAELRNKNDEELIARLKDEIGHIENESDGELAAKQIAEKNAQIDKIVKRVASRNKTIENNKKKISEFESIDAAKGKEYEAKKKALEDALKERAEIRENIENKVKAEREEAKKGEPKAENENPEFIVYSDEKIDNAINAAKAAIARETNKGPKNLERIFKDVLGSSGIDYKKLLEPDKVRVDKAMAELVGKKEEVVRPENEDETRKDEKPENNVSPIKDLGKDDFGKSIMAAIDAIMADPNVPGFDVDDILEKVEISGTDKNGKVRKIGLSGDLRKSYKDYIKKNSSTIKEYIDKKAEELKQNEQEQEKE